MTNRSDCLIFHEMDQSDWLAFSGAERWENGARPLISEGTLADGTLFVLVIDPNGACLILDDEHAECGGYQICQDFTSQAAARAWFYSSILKLDKSSFFEAGFDEV